MIIDPRIRSAAPALSSKKMSKKNFQWSSFPTATSGNILSYDLNSSVFIWPPSCIGTLQIYIARLLLHHCSVCAIQAGLVLIMPIDLFFKIPIAYKRVTCFISSSQRSLFSDLSTKKNLTTSHNGLSKTISRLLVRSLVRLCISASNASTKSAPREHHPKVRSKKI